MFSARTYLPGLMLACCLLALMRIASGPAVARPDEPPPPPRIAWCDVWSIAYELAISSKHQERDERLLEERDKSTKPLRDDLAETEKRINELQEAGVDPDTNEDARRLLDEYYETSRALEAKMEEYSARRQTVFVENILDRCREVREAAEIVGRERGFEYVLSSCDPAASKRAKALAFEQRRAEALRDGEDFEESAEETYGDVFYTERFRIIAAGPDNIQIDDLVRERLGLE